MITKIKEIKEILPETLDYFLMNENEFYAQEEKIEKLIYNAIRKKTNWEKTDGGLKRSIVAVIQRIQFDTIMQIMKRKNRKRYDNLMQDLKDKKGDAKIDVYYFESITSGCFMQAMKESYSMYRK